MNARKLFVMVVVMMATLALVGVASAAGEKPAPANEIVLHDQEIHQGILLVDSVTAEKDGWLVIYERPSLDKDAIVGYAPVHKGLNPNLRVTLDTKLTKDLPMLWAQLHVDNAPVGIFEWGYNHRAFNDPPVVSGGQPLVKAFYLNGDSAPLAIAPAISVKSQEIRQGPVVFDSVTTPVDGWVVVYRDPSFTPGTVVGYAPVYQGTNSNVKVSIDAKSVQEGPTLWAVLQADKGAHGLFEWGKWGRTMADAPVIDGGQPVFATFGIRAQ